MSPYIHGGGHFEFYSRWPPEIDHNLFAMVFEILMPIPTTMPNLKNLAPSARSIWIPPPLPGEKPAWVIINNNVIFQHIFYKKSIRKSKGLLKVSECPFHLTQPHPHTWKRNQLTMTVVKLSCPRQQWISSIIPHILPEASSLAVNWRCSMQGRHLRGAGGAVAPQGKRKKEKKKEKKEKREKKKKKRKKERELWITWNYYI